MTGPRCREIERLQQIITRQEADLEHRAETADYLADEIVRLRRSRDAWRELCGRRRGALREARGEVTEAVQVGTGYATMLRFAGLTAYLEEDAGRADT